MKRQDQSLKDIDFSLQMSQISDLNNMNSSILSDNDSKVSFILDQNLNFDLNLVEKKHRNEFKNATTRIGSRKKIINDREVQYLLDIVFKSACKETVKLKNWQAVYGSHFDEYGFLNKKQDYPIFRYEDVYKSNHQSKENSIIKEKTTPLNEIRNQDMTVKQEGFDVIETKKIIENQFMDSAGFSQVKFNRLNSDFNEKNETVVNSNLLIKDHDLKFKDIEKKIETDKIENQSTEGGNRKSTSKKIIKIKINDKKKENSDKINPLKINFVRSPLSLNTQSDFKFEREEHQYKSETPNLFLRERKLLDSQKINNFSYLKTGDLKNGNSKNINNFRQSAEIFKSKLLEEQNDKIKDNQIFKKKKFEVSNTISTIAKINLFKNFNKSKENTEDENQNKNDKRGSFFKKYTSGIAFQRKSTEINKNLAKLVLPVLDNNTKIR